MPARICGQQTLEGFYGKDIKKAQDVSSRLGLFGIGLKDLKKDKINSQYRLGFKRLFCD